MVPFDYQSYYPKCTRKYYPPILPTLHFASLKTSPLKNQRHSPPKVTRRIRSTVSIASFLARRGNRSRSEKARRERDVDERRAGGAKRGTRSRRGGGCVARFHKAILRTLFSHAHVESKARPISYGDSLTSSVHHRICLYRRRY